MRRLMIIVAASATLGGCASGLGGEGFGYGDYSLIRARTVPVGDGSVVVTPVREWNRVSTTWSIDDIRAVEDWTLNLSLIHI